METMIVFCHIEKTAGTALTELLRAHFGLRHVDVLRHAITSRDGVVAPNFYDAEDLLKDRRLYPRMRSLAGHHIRPCVDFGEFDGDMHWYTFLRDPIARLRSHYLHEVAIKNYSGSFPEYLDKFPRDDIMVRKLAGERDLAAAKSILSTRMRFVGIQERFDQSLLLMRDALGLGDFSVSYAKRRNTAVSRVGGPIYRLRGRLTKRSENSEIAMQERAKSSLEQHHGLLVEANSLDQQLYEYACNEIWSQQVDQYGGTERLAADTQVDMSKAPNSSYRTTLSFVYRNLVYKPYVAADVRRNQRLGVQKTTNTRQWKESKRNHD